MQPLSAGPQKFPPQRPADLDTAVSFAAFFWRKLWVRQLSLLRALGGKGSGATRWDALASAEDLRRSGLGLLCESAFAFALSSQTCFG